MFCAEQSASYCTERYRSGHNEAVLKTVCPQGRVGSNPTLSVIFLPKRRKRRKRFAMRILYFCKNSEKYPSWPKGHPWKGCRSLTAARGFKSLLLRSPENIFKKDVKNLLTRKKHHANINRLPRFRLRMYIDN